MWNAVSHMQHLDKITRFLIFPFLYRLTFLFYNFKKHFTSARACLEQLRALRAVWLHIPHTCKAENQEKDKSLTRLRVDWLGSNVRKGLAAILLMSLSRRCSLRRAAGGRKRHTTCRAFVALSSSSPDWGSAVQHKKQCCTVLSKYSLGERFWAQQQSKEGGGAAVPGFKTKVQNLRERLRAQVQSEEGGGAAVPDLQTKVQSLGKIQSPGTVQRGRWSCCTWL